MCDATYGNACPLEYWWGCGPSGPCFVQMLLRLLSFMLWHSLGHSGLVNWLPGLKVILQVGLCNWPMSSWGLQLALQFSKTDQTGKGALISLGACDDTVLCPVLAVRQYLALHGATGGCLFLHKDLSLLTRYQFWWVTWKALDGLGLSGCQFGTHSFRIGAASTAAAMGYQHEDLQRICRWRSSCYKRYIQVCKI